MNNFTPEEKQIIFEVADASIKNGLEKRAPLRVNPQNFAAKFQEPGASFVTLEINGMLRGCIGSLEAYQALIVDVANNAYAAAFTDPRFFPLTAAEYPHVNKHISILTKPEPLAFTSEADLLQKIRPGIDGLILSDRGHRGTFLPSVWESLATPELFLNHLKQKAGLPMDYWSDTLQVERYTTEVIE